MKTTSGDKAYFSVGIEGYTRPGLYRAADVVFFVLHGAGLAQWQAPSTALTVTGQSLLLPRTVLEPAPGTSARSQLVAVGTLPCTSH